MTIDELTDAQRESLYVLAGGAASRSTRLRDDPAAGFRSIAGRVANELIALGLARDVPQWRAVELTDAGRALVA